MPKNKNILIHEPIIEQEKNGMEYGIICIIDALGTKGVWGQIGAKKYLDILEKLETEISKKLEYINSLELDFKSKISILSFSDTFFITQQFQYDERIDHSVFIKTFSFIIAHFFYMALTNKIFFRGAISHGMFCKRNNTIIGPAVDDAASYFEKPNLIGVICTPSASLAYLASKSITPNEFDYLIDYNTPIKGIENKMQLVNLNWPKLFMENYKNLEKKVIGPFEMIQRYFSEYPIPEHTIDKYTNTLEFVKFSLSTQS